MPHLEDDRDGEYAKGRQLRRFYVSRRFQREGPDGVPSGEFSRFAYQVFDADSDVVFASDNGWEILLRETPTRQQLKALFFEDDRRIETLAFQRFDAQGERSGGEFQANSTSQDRQTYPTVAVAPGGNFLVLWSSFEQDGDLFGVFARRFGEGGEPTPCPANSGST